MKTNKNLSPEISFAMNQFVQQLPDAAKSYQSTIEDVVMMDQRKIKFMAQKIKGTKGLCWHIRYKTSTDS